MACSSLQENYDVFLSFRGEDTRYGFTSYLERALREKNIKTYMDEQNLESGDEISPTLSKAIKESKICLIIFSKKFASSTWCLNEVLEILKCKRNRLVQNVIPIFYCIDPSIVRKQKERYADAFAKHEERLGMDKVQEWRDALEKVADLCGYDSKNFRPEYELIEKIVDDISSKLNKHLSTNDHYEGNFIGIEKRIKKLEQLLCIGSMDVRFIGVWGMGGIGKTTLASNVFDTFYSHFDISCFLKNVREESERQGIDQLRNNLLSMLLKDKNIMHMTSTPYAVSPDIQDRLRRLKALVVLDDVDEMSKLIYLLQGYKFGVGSRIIVTSRDIQVLKEKTKQIYEVKRLNHVEALELFRLHAFKENSLATDFETLSEEMANYAHGNPLALKVLGSYLYSKTKKDWESAFDKLKMNQHKDIKKVLRISYDGLEDKNKELFLDIAHFFNGEDREYVESILNQNDQHDARSGISDLIDKSLVTESEKRLWMHDLLQQMGWEIVRAESKEPGNRSRLRDAEDICHVLKTNTGTSTIEGMSFNQSELEKDVEVSPTVFSNMDNLRILKIHNVEVRKNNCKMGWESGPSHRKKSGKMYFSQGLKYLPGKLRFLHWDAYPFEALPSDFSPENLVDLVMPKSQLALPWNDRPLRNLMRIDLSYCDSLTHMPNLCGAARLEYINMRDCTSLTELPPYFSELEGLKHLDLRGCLKLEYLPEILKPMEHLQNLWLDGSGIKELPESIENLISLSELNLNNCRSLKSLPKNIWKLKYLDSLVLSDCPSMEKFPEILDVMPHLHRIRLEGTGIEGLPESIENVVALRELDLCGCRKLKSLPESICKLKDLEELNLSFCQKLETFPEIRSQMEYLHTIRLNGTGIEGLSESIKNLTGLQKLRLSCCKRLKSLPKSIWKMKNLETLLLSDCPNLESLPEISDPVEHLHEIWLDGTGIEGLPESIEKLIRLRKLDLSRCNKMKFLPNSLRRLRRLKKLIIKGCSSLEELPLLPFGLLKLHMSNCERLKTLAEPPSCLRYLVADDCISLKTISSWSTPTRKDFGKKDYIYYFGNCLKLDSNTCNNIIAKHAWLRILSDARARKDGHYVPPSMFLYPGDEIPKWCIYQTLGNSLNMELPLNWFDAHLSFVVCIVLLLNDPPLAVEIPYKFSFETNSDDGPYSFGNVWTIDRGNTKQDHVLIMQHYLTLDVDQFQRLFAQNWSSIGGGTTEASFCVSLGKGVKGEIKKLGMQFISNDQQEYAGECSNSRRRQRCLEDDNCGCETENQAEDESYTQINSERLKLKGPEYAGECSNEGRRQICFSDDYRCQTEHQHKDESYPQINSKRLKLKGKWIHEFYQNK